MFNRIKQKVARLLMIMSFTALIMGLFGFTPAQADPPSGGFSFTVVGTDFSHDEASFSFEDEHIIKVGGDSDQVSWEVENSTATISPKAIKAAPRIHTKCTESNRRTQSQQIWRQTHHATVVVVMPGSCLWNRGRHDKIMMGFPWKVAKPAILVGDKQHRYRHGFTLVQNKSQVADDEEVVGKVQFMGQTWLIVRKCRNFIGGPVDVYVPSAVQLHYASDIKKHAKAVATTHVEGTVTFNITCPNGANFNTRVHTWADGEGSAEIDFTERTRVSVLDAHKAQLSIDSEGDGEVSATSNAGSEITVSGTCGDNPQPNYKAPDVSATPSACVEQGKETGYIDVAVTNPNTLALPGHTYLNGGSPFDLGNITPGGGSATHRYPGLAAGTYSVKGTLDLPDGTVLSDTMSVVVPKCDTPTQNPPSITEVEQPNDVLVNNSRTIRVRGFVPAGQTATLNATAQYGTIKSGSTTSVTGQFDVTVTYEAPSEVPAGGNDTVTFMVINSSGQKDTKSVTFQIRPAPVDPL